jgi:hypothetical protein
MTMAEAVDAPLLYCGRLWSDFLPDVAAGVVDPALPVEPELDTPAPSVVETPPRVVETAIPVDKPAEISVSVAPAVVAPDPEPAPSPVQPLAQASASPPNAPAKPATARSSAPGAVTAPQPPAPPKPALSTAAVALADTARAMQAAKPPRAMPSPRPTRRFSAPSGDGLSAFRAAEIGRGVTSFRPDPPAHARGVTVIAVAGDPPPGRSALDERNARGRA